MKTTTKKRIEVDKDGNEIDGYYGYDIVELYDIDRYNAIVTEDEENDDEC